MLSSLFKRFFNPKIVSDVAIASDHRGVELRHRLVRWLEETGHTVKDFGPKAEIGSVDYPDYAKSVGEAVQCGTAKRGILICGTGIGMSIAANKVEGVRAARVVTVEEARLSRLHNDSNILCIGENTHELETLIHEWLTTGFEGGRHERRVEKITNMEFRFNYLP
jgi:ribose 5-phosphate isomerase B